MIRAVALFFALGTWCAACPTPPKPPPTCGDGERSAAEECDEGNANDDTRECTSQCRWATCGDGFVLEGVEACDDGTQNGYTAACTPLCQVAVCGDGHIFDAVEECDDGGANSDDASCTSQCRAARCGDGLLRVGVEECDDGNNFGGDGCASHCREPFALSLGDAPVELLNDAFHVAARGGDVNGDGNADLLISDTYRDNFSGGVYVVYGPIEGRFSVESAANVAILDGPVDYQRAGTSIAGGGDLNGDGFDDVLIGAPTVYGDTAYPEGMVHVVYGPVGGTVDLAVSSVTLYGESEFAGEWVSMSGDLNADGFDDALIGVADDVAPFGSGVAYVMHGPILATDTLAGADAKLIGIGVPEDPSGRNHVGQCVASVGDTSGDGVPDLLVSGYILNWVVYGPVAGVINVADADVSVEDGGYGCAPVGDVDLDGREDYSVGLTLYSGATVGNLTAADARANLLVDDWATLAGAGDTDGDGRGDIVIGVSSAFDNRGAAYVLHGDLQGVVEVALTSDAVLEGVAADDLAGWAVAGAGDLDGDGLAEVAVSAVRSSPFVDMSVYVVSGGDL